MLMSAPRLCCFLSYDGTVMLLHMRFFNYPDGAPGHSFAHEYQSKSVSLPACLFHLDDGNPGNSVRTVANHPVIACYNKGMACPHLFSTPAHHASMHARFDPLYRNILPYDTIPYDTIPYDTIPYHTIPYHGCATADATSGYA